MAPDPALQGVVSGPDPTLNYPTAKIREGGSLEEVSGFLRSTHIFSLSCSLSHTHVHMCMHVHTHSHTHKVCTHAGTEIKINGKRFGLGMVLHTGNPRTRKAETGEREREFKASLDYITRLYKNEQPLGHRQEGRLRKGCSRGSGEQMSVHRAEGVQRL